MKFNQFSDLIVPEIENYDNSFLKKIDDLNIKKGKQDKGYLIAGGKKSYYPVFFLFKNAFRYERKELKSALIELGEADNSIKNGAEPIKIIENFIFKFVHLKK
jgi:DNA polymerase III delta subunit